MANETSQRSGLSAAFTMLNGLFERIPYSAVALLARGIIGLVFWNSGRTKVEGFSIRDATFALFENEYKVPLIPSDIAAYMATFAEHAFPILLWVGLASRLSAAALLAMTAVIQIFVYPSAYVTHGLWAVALLIIIIRGPGCISLDHWLGLDKHKC
ncbi:MAG: DoxX family protein [Alphaproteobacteria bacterium]|nr:DoxX family protein [Alphaproteobacteria bacterium]